MAKYNTDRWFPVVGVVEYWNETFALVENRFPSYFHGIKDFYYNVKGGNNLQRHVDNFEGVYVSDFPICMSIRKKRGFVPELREHESSRVPYISEEARAKLKEILAIEYDFYNFLSQRVERQYKQLQTQIEDAGESPVVSDDEKTL